MTQEIIDVHKAFVTSNGNKLSSNPYLDREHILQMVSNMIGVGFVEPLPRRIDSI